MQEVPADVSPPPAPSLPLPVAVRDAVTAENAAERAGQLAERVLAAEAPGLSFRDREALASEVREQFAIYFAADFEELLRSQAKRGAQTMLIDQLEATSEEYEQRKQWWSTLAGIIAERPVSINEAVIRPRYIDGREVRHPGSGPSARVTAPSRFNLSDDPLHSRLTVYEVVLPVMYEWRNAKGPVWWGLWFARDPSGNRGWLVYRSVVYDPAGIGVTALPPI